MQKKIKVVSRKYIFIINSPNYVKFYENYNSLTTTLLVNSIYSLNILRKVRNNKLTEVIKNEKTSKG